MVLSVDYETKTLTQIKYFQNYPVLEYKISYPQFRSNYFFKSAQKMNQYYRREAIKFEIYCRTVLYRMAIELAEEQIKNGYPIMKFESYDSFKITYNENCALSMYSDRYIYTGGAHGTTQRSADTWTLNGGGSKISLKEIFPSNYPVRQRLEKDIVAQIEQQIANGGTYFENGEQNVSDTLHEENFYLTQQGLIIFFQQYDIAPYSSGIPTFLFPYQKNGPMPPNC